MTSPLIDDSLVEMVETAIIAEMNSGRHTTPEALARAALAVAVPHVVGRCASAAASIRQPVSETYVPSFDGPFSRGFSLGRERARDAIRSLTKDPQS